MILIFIAVKNRYLNLSAVLKNTKIQNEPNEPKRSNATHNDQAARKANIIVGSWKSRFKIFGFKYLWNQ